MVSATLIGGGGRVSVRVCPCINNNKSILPVCVDNKEEIARLLADLSCSVCGEPSNVLESVGPVRPGQAKPDQTV